VSSIPSRDIALASGETEADARNTTTTTIRSSRTMNYDQ